VFRIPVSVPSNSSSTNGLLSQYLVEGVNNTHSQRKAPLNASLRGELLHIPGPPAPVSILAGTPVNDRRPSRHGIISPHQIEDTANSIQAVVDC
jgi:hypothetical protein